jgi:hypothetical protein
MRLDVKTQQEINIKKQLKLPPETISVRQCYTCGLLVSGIPGRHTLALPLSPRSAWRAAQPSRGT